MEAAHLDFGLANELQQLMINAKIPMRLHDGIVQFFRYHCFCKISDFLKFAAKANDHEWAEAVTEAGAPSDIGKRGIQLAFTSAVSFRAPNSLAGHIDKKADAVTKEMGAKTGPEAVTNAALPLFTVASGPAPKLSCIPRLRVALELFEKGPTCPQLQASKSRGESNDVGDRFCKKKVFEHMFLHIKHIPGYESESDKPTSALSLGVSIAKDLKIYDLAIAYIKKNNLSSEKPTWRDGMRILEDEEMGLYKCKMAGAVRLLKQLLNVAPRGRLDPLPVLEGESHIPDDDVGSVQHDVVLPPPSIAAAAADQLIECKYGSNKLHLEHSSHFDLSAGGIRYKQCKTHRKVKRETDVSDDPLNTSFTMVPIFDCVTSMHRQTRKGCPAENMSNYCYIVHDIRTSSWMTRKPSRLHGNGERIAVGEERPSSNYARELGKKFKAFILETGAVDEASLMSELDNVDGDCKPTQRGISDVSAFLGVELLVSSCNPICTIRFLCRCGKADRVETEVHEDVASALEKSRTAKPAEMNETMLIEEREKRSRGTRRRKHTIKDDFKVGCTHSVSIQLLWNLAESKLHRFVKFFVSKEHSLECIAIREATKDRVQQYVDMKPIDDWICKMFRAGIHAKHVLMYITDSEAVPAGVEHPPLPEPAGVWPVTDKHLEYLQRRIKSEGRLSEDAHTDGGSKLKRRKLSS